MEYQHTIMMKMVIFMVMVIVITMNTHPFMKIQIMYMIDGET